MIEITEWNLIATGFCKNAPSSGERSPRFSPRLADRPKPRYFCIVHQLRNSCGAQVSDSFHSISFRKVFLPISPS
jgi:hypothetical protein